MVNNAIHCIVSKTIQFHNKCEVHVAHIAFYYTIRPSISLRVYYMRAYSLTLAIECTFFFLFFRASLYQNHCSRFLVLSIARLLCNTLNCSLIESKFHWFDLIDWLIDWGTYISIIMLYLPPFFLWLVCGCYWNIMALKCLVL